MSAFLFLRGEIVLKTIRRDDAGAEETQHRRPGLSPPLGGGKAKLQPDQIQCHEQHAQDPDRKKQQRGIGHLVGRCGHWHGDRGGRALPRRWICQLLCHAQD